MRTQISLLLLGLLILGFSNCTIFSPDPNHKSWGYQLQNYKDAKSLKWIKESSIPLWVIDYSKDGRQEKAFSRKEIKSLKKKTVLSYMSIGEAEEYRYYYKNMPKKLLLKENKNWKGNHKIKFWNPKWKSIIIGRGSYTEKILSAGFDGVYLDIVDAFEYFKDKKKKAGEMAKFIIEISQYAKAINPNFKIIIQNGVNILAHLSNSDNFLNSIDGAALEDLFFLGEKKHDNQWRPQKYLFQYIKMIQDKKLPVFSVEYIKDKKKIEKYFKEAKKHKLIPLVADRELRGDLIFSFPK